MRVGWIAQTTGAWAEARRVWRLTTMEVTALLLWKVVARHIDSFRASYADFVRSTLQTTCRRRTFRVTWLGLSACCHLSLRMADRLTHGLVSTPAQSLAAKLLGRRFVRLMRNAW